LIPEKNDSFLFQIQAGRMIIGMLKDVIGYDALGVSVPQRIQDMYMQFIHAAADHFLQYTGSHATTLPENKEAKIYKGYEGYIISVLS